MTRSDRGASQSGEAPEERSVNQPGKGVDVLTFGCRLNAYESEAMKALALAAGHERTIVVNTCAVTGEAERQARQAIRKAAREHPEARLVLVHALDPAAFAGVAGDPNWPAAMLKAEITEDLRKVCALAVLALEEGPDLKPVLAAQLPDAGITTLPSAADAASARGAIAAFFAQ